MAYQKYIFYFIFLLFPLSLFSQKFGFNKVLTNSPEIQIPFSIENNERNINLLRNEGIEIKQQTENWLFFTQTASWIDKQFKAGVLTDFHFEYAPPSLLDDSSRVKSYTNEVHQGNSPLMAGYTGKGVLLGIVDSALDYDHPDFIKANGIKRVIRYWNQKEGSSSASPQPYGYGTVYGKEYLQENSNTFSSNSDLGHGTTVTGISGGNGLANGKNKGMAPDTEIIFVESDFSRPNWTLTVADACDYIFRVADSLGKPAVINLSLGTSLGSRDGTDPAGELMAQLVTEQRGRIIIAAAGNSGDYAPFHAQQTMTPADTNFIWFKTNPNGTLGAKTVLFDLWSDINEAQYHYSFGVNRNAPGYEDVGSTTYRFVQVNVGTPILDTIYNEHGDRIATIEIYSEYQGNNYHMQGFFSHVDSSNYLLRFSTTGTGKYDLWSGVDNGLNEIVENIPSPEDYPAIVNYVLPDSAQSVVSSWNCSPDIISVANFRNRYRYLDVNGNYYYHANMTQPGDIAESSSRGPNRKGLIKPDIAASGEMNLASAPMYLIENGTSSSLGEGGMHMRNNGTSMAAPIVAGIAALYLEKCPNATFEEFKQDLFNTGYNDQFTGELPNNRFGYGKVHALDLLTQTNGDLSILGNTAICQMPVKLTSSEPLVEYNWSNNTFDPTVIVPQPGEISLWGINQSGCTIYSDTVEVVQGSPLENPTIHLEGSTLVASEAPNYQWYLNDSPISGATEQQFTPEEAGYYSVAIQGPDNCKSFSNAFYWVLSLEEETLQTLIVYPNPTQTVLNIELNGDKIEKIEVFSPTGQKVIDTTVNASKTSINVTHLAKGIYYLQVKTSQKNNILSFFKD